MNEDFLHYLWQYQLLSPSLSSTDGEKIEILFPGYHNHNAGPDFLEAKIRIGEVIWAGNVELHIQTSDWFRHKHQNDDNYDTIILHVAYKVDQKLFRKNGEAIPQLELKGKFNENSFAKYQYFLQNKNWIACEKMIHEAPRLIVNSWIDRLIVERMEKRSQEIGERLQKTKNNWEQAFYETIARNFGFHTNAHAFESLARSLPLHIIAKQKNNLFQIEALLYGQAGLLQEDFTDEYPVLLQNEYEFLKRKFKLLPLSKNTWKFARMRPGNFPGIRIAQFAHLLYRSSKLFSKILEQKNLKDVQELFKVEVSAYWQTHYSFDKISPHRKKSLSSQGINLILINTIIPFLYYYGKNRNNEEMLNRALKFLEQIPGEKNAITNQWKKLDLTVNSALHTQALLHLKNEYCKRKQCLKCGIGVHLLK
jgi:hypothetical protein